MFSFLFAEDFQNQLFVQIFQECNQCFKEFNPYKPSVIFVVHRQPSNNPDETPRDVFARNLIKHLSGIYEDIIVSKH